MRTLSAGQQAIWNSGNQSEHVRVFIKDAGGTFRDLTTYPGFNAVKTVSYSEKIENPHATCDIVLHRELYKRSLAPFVSSSPVNIGYQSGNPFTPLIGLNHELYVEVAVTPFGTAPQSGDWMEEFRGRVDEFDEASGYDIRLSCRSLGGRLAQQFIKTELVYAFASSSGTARTLQIWQPQMAVTNGVTYLLPASRGASDSGVNKFFVCSQSGTTGTTEPTWTTGTNIVDNTARWNYVGAPTSSGVAVEQVIQAILNDHKASSDPTVTLYVPSSPGWAIRQFIQQREFVLDAVLALAKQIGWALRYKWRAATSQFEFTFYQPQRSSPSVDFTFAKGDYEHPTKLAVSIAEIRNAWRGVYSDASDLLPDGTPKRKVIEVSDATSITKYGELWAEIQEAQASQIDSSTEMTTLLNAALSDCKEPTASLAVTLTRGFPWVELNDYVTFEANGLHFDSNQSLAVTGWTKTHNGKGFVTTLELRGLPTIGAQSWIDQTVHPLNPTRERPPRLMSFNGGTPSLEVNSIVGGVTASMNLGSIDKVNQAEEYEIHINESTGFFTPDNTTLHSVIKDKASAVANLVPGRTVYVKAVPRTRDQDRLSRGQPSAAVSAVTGRVTTDYLDSLAIVGGPLNGEFEDYPRAGEQPPHWSSVTWGDSNGTNIDSDGVVGRLITFGQKSDLVSDVFPIGDSPYAVLTARAKYSEAGLPDLEVIVTWYSDPVTYLDEDLFYITDSVGTVDTWSRFTMRTDPPPGANYAQVSLRRDDSSSEFWSIGDIRLDLFPRSIYKFLTEGFPAPLRIAGGNNWNTWDGEGDVRIGNSVNALKFGIATGGGGAGSATIAAEGGVNTLSLGAGTTQAHQQAIQIASGVVSLAQRAWVNVTYNTGWRTYAGWQGVQYYKDPNGIVRVRGMAQRASGSATTIFTLPTGFRPSANLVFPCDSNGVYGRIEVYAGGSVALSGGAPTAWVSMCFDFDTR